VKEKMQRLFKWHNKYVVTRQNIYKYCASEFKESRALTSGYKVDYINDDPKSSLMTAAKTPSRYKENYQIY
jgi:hypothetical protein